MSEQPRDLNPADLFGDIESDQGREKPIEESELTMSATEELRHTSPARQGAREREATFREGVEVDITDLDEPAPDKPPMPEEVVLSVDDLDDGPAETDNEELFEIVEDNLDEEVRIEERGPMSPGEAAAVREALSGRFEHLQQGAELSQADVQGLMYDMAEQVALEKYGTAAPLDNIKDSRGMAVDFWNARPDALRVFEMQVREAGPEEAFRIIEQNLDKWVPEFQAVQQPASAEATALERAREAIALEGLDKEKETLSKLSEQLSADPETPDKYVFRQLSESMRALVDNNDHIPGMNELVTKLAPLVPDIKGTNVIEKTKEYVVNQALTNSRREIRQALVNQGPDAALTEMAAAVEKLRPSLERRISEDQERRSRAAAAARKERRAGRSAKKPEEKRSWWDRLTGRNAA